MKLSSILPLSTSSRSMGNSANSTSELTSLVCGSHQVLRKYLCSTKLRHLLNENPELSTSYLHTEQFIVMSPSFRLAPRAVDKKCPKSEVTVLPPQYPRYLIS